jgi:hypothetical protein
VHGFVRQIFVSQQTYFIGQVRVGKSVDCPKSTALLLEETTSRQVGVLGFPFQESASLGMAHFSAALK